MDALERGLLVVHPTETVASLSGDPYREEAVAAARRLKGYAEPRPFLCLVPGLERARALARAWPPAAQVLASAFWPGPLTLVLPAAADAPAGVTDDGTIALRPAVDPVSVPLLAAWARPLFSTSANPRGEPPPVDVGRALSGLAGIAGAEAIAVALTPPGRVAAAGSPSTIVDVTAEPPRVVRRGALPVERLREVLPSLEEAPE